MSSKSSKKTAATSSSSNVATPSQPPATSTPLSDNRRPSGSLSPTKYSRIQEKEDLANLNDRLACYIEKVRQLELENSRLSRQVQTSQEIGHREVTNIQFIYETELADTRKLLDETSKDRAKLEIDIKRLWDDQEELKSKYDQKVKDCQIAERNVMIYENRCSDIQSKHNQSQSELKKLQDEKREIEKENERLSLLLADARKHLEEETLQRIDLENHIQSMKEESTFKDQIYQQKISETRTRREVEISEIDGRLAEQYEDKLQKSLQELREQYEAQMQANRNEIKLLYDTKIQNFTANAQRNNEVANGAVEGLRQTRHRVEELNGRISELENLVNALNTRNRELENSREHDRSRHAENMATLESELHSLRGEMANQLKEYQDLMDIKVALDLEIAAYRKLLESEEARLNITPMSSPISMIGRTTPSRSSHTPMRGGKRKRTVLEESESTSTSDFNITCSSKGEIEISEVDPQGRFVKLSNKGNKEMGLSGWQIKRSAGGMDVVYKFHRTMKIDTGAHVTVWSADTGAMHEPPTNLVMKGQKWFVADHTVTVLLNNDGEEVAKSERKRVILNKSVSRHRENYGFRSSEELHHQQADPPSVERCSIM